MTSPTFTLPLEEWIKSIRAEWRRHEPFIAGALSHHAQEELALAAIAVLAPMIAEECAKELDSDAQTYEEAAREARDAGGDPDGLESKARVCRVNAAAIRSKFPSSTGEKGK